MPNLLNVATGGLLYLLTYITLIPLTKTIKTSEVRRAASIIQKIKPLWYITKPILQYQQKIIGITTKL
jgi:hypothetical protein